MDHSRTVKHATKLASQKKNGGQRLGKLRTATGTVPPSTTPDARRCGRRL